ncbi:endo-1,3-alpha-glucanase family glycosylhydrolase [Shewanella sp. FJAT-52076]|uniref:endo-1,3-alpha-glucanase family glycosylhydrolase n=1 Tax=Shewanella sp. FJAT-52076 TaxID=2864202 RepID=UPI0021AC52E3|nr:endo-1,3-alpha-glucanase family glycosylhydrolase [Shewanella sp. FJAT-52076]
MIQIYRILLLVLFTCSLPGCSKGPSEPSGNSRLHVFYYGWYGNPQQDGQWQHWNHRVLPYGDIPLEGRLDFPGADDIGANFYPELGSYSSHDPEIIEQHLEMMRQAGIGVVSVSWLGADDFAARSIDLFMDKAAEKGLQINFHIEPNYRSAEEFHAIITELMQKFGTHPALYRYQGKPLYYVYDSYKLPVSEWQKLLLPGGELSLRTPELDGQFIGLWVNQGEEAFFLTTGFDGFYTYFASEGFVWGSTSANWPYLADWASAHGKLFIPSVGPGYADDRIRPWNGANFKSREQGRYYDQMFSQALKTRPDIVTITSFNEWHEGTQIEPAAVKQLPDYRYLDYGDLPGDYYLKRTLDWSRKLSSIPLNPQPQEGSR